ncbi:SH2 domain-containing protein 4A isoform X1 [Anolis carolinensis]|uniref:SH2 domain-containing protein 4A isoform X1 n=1 Tax=Anolis carolinensis TaxID=28377 RepID=UPI002F2B2DD1
MLKQILADMYVDPELLAELSEEQKQILFFKMRQEQIRRWKEREDAATVPKPARKAGHGKSVQWKLGSDGDIWVWVMGEHSLDKPYDVLCSEILAERVRQQSLQEAEAKRRGSVEEVTEHHVMSHPHCLSDTHLGSEIQRDNKSPMNWLKGAAIQNQDQPSANKLRGIEEMLADSVRHSRKYGNLQSKENPVKTTMDETGAQEESVHKLEKEDPSWLETLQRSKAADERRSSLAKHARDDYKRLSLQGIHKGKAAEVSKIFKASEQKQLVPPPLPPKPKNLPAPGVTNGRPDRRRGIQRTVSSSTEEGIIRWFKEEQLPLRAGFEKSTDYIAPWFHGILTIKKAEELLNGLTPGSFLIRVSEKIKGYVLSYLSAEGCKHFLIDASGDSYSFLGVDQLQHSTLADLVDYHKDEPITSLGKELLRYPCGQRRLEPDYLDLFE